MNEQQKWQNEVRDIYKKIKKHKEKYFINVNGLKLCIYPNVFSPAYFTDSEWFSKIIPQIVEQRELLEVGTGTGIVALFSAIKGAGVTVTDINCDAVENAKYNFKLHKLDIDAYCGDMYDSLPKNKKYDFIFWNHPFNYGGNPKEEVLLKAGFDFKYKSLEKYIFEADLYLKPNGKLLLGTGGFALIDEIENIADKYNYKVELIEKTEMPLTEGSSNSNDYRIYEFIKK